MWLRKILIAVAVAAPLAWTPAPVAAQERGLDRAATATANADAVEGWTHKKTPKDQKGLPNGIARHYEDGDALPPGISRNRQLPQQDVALPPQPEPEPDPQPEPQPDPEPCATTVVMINFQFFVQDCHGTLFPL